MKSLGHFLDEAKATYCGRCGTTHVPPSKGGTCPAVKEEVNPAHYDIAGLIKKAKAKNDPKHPAMKHVAAIEDIKKHGGALSVHGDHVRSLIKALGEEVQIEEGEEKGGGYDGMPKGLQDRTPRGSSRGAMGRAIAKKERNLERIRRERALRKEEAEGLEEISKGTLGRYINKAKDSIDTASYRQGHKEAHGSSSKPLEKKLTKRHKGIETAVKKLTKEEAESIDELSKATLGSYTKKAARSTAGLAANAAARAALHGRASEYDKRTLRNRLTGISKATDRMTKEEVEELDEISAAKLRDYSDAATDARGHRKLPTAKLDQRYKSMALAHEKIRARHAKVAATEGTNMKTLSQFFEEANNNLFEGDQIKAHHERVKKLKGKKVTFTHPVSKQKISGTMQKIVQMGGLPYAHVETGKSAHRVPVHQID